MGMNPRAKLVYGYALGGDEGGWEVQEAGEYGQWEPDWLNAENDDLITDAEKVLLASVGFTETDWEAEGYFDRQRAAEKRLGVTFVPHGGEFSCWALVCHEITVEWGEAAEVDLTSLMAAVGEGGWDAKLAAAVEALGATPKQGRPSWLLLAFWG
jgi:hypothetical protein